MEYIYIEGSSEQDCRQKAKQWYDIRIEVKCEILPFAGSSMYYFFGFGYKIKNN